MNHRHVTLVDDLKSDLRDDKVALLLGTGVTRAITANAPAARWDGLLENALDYLSNKSSEATASAYRTLMGADPAPDVLISIATWVESRLSAPTGGEYQRWLFRTVGALVPDNEHELVKSMPKTKYVLTTNYDDTWKAILPDRQPITWTDDHAAETYLRNPEQYVFHLHGYYKRPVSVVLGGQSYGALGVSEVSLGVLKTIAQQQSLCMVGCGGTVDDPSIGKLLKWLNDTQWDYIERHYALLVDSEAEKIDDGRGSLSKITAIGYGSGHEYLAGFLSELEEDDSKVDGEESESDDEADDLESYGDLVGEFVHPDLDHRLREELGPVADLSEFQRRGITLMASASARSEAALVCAVTGTGKTTIARAVMNLLIDRSRSAVGLFPTKAIVTQEYRQWQPWETFWERELGRELEVYPASRDYPDNDRPVSRGQFDVAIGIYEKLGVYLVNGRSPLSGTELVVLDELQLLAENSERSRKLEAILTIVKLQDDSKNRSLLGLSPSMGSGATQILREWWGVPEQNFLQWNTRPIRLDTYVVDGIGWRRQENSHLFNVPGEAPPQADPYEQHGLKDRAIDNRNFLKNGDLSQTAGILSATLADYLLEKSPDERIIVFVSSRKRAQDVALAIQKLIEKRAGRVSRENPWKCGRFCHQGDETTPTDLYGQLRHLNLPGADLVLKGLREGVAAHSAELSPSLRRVLEEEFRRPEGLLRVLVATDTLAMGINLPADVVIASTITGYADDSDDLQFLTPENLDNKAGRAGRVGHSRAPVGKFYLLVPSKAELSEVRATQHEKEDLSRIEGVLARFVRGPRNSLRIVSSYRTLTDVCSLVLQVLCCDGFGRSEQAFQRRVQEIRNGLLLSHEHGSDVPTVEQIVEELAERKLVHVRPSDTKTAVTKLGHALASSGLELELATTLERVARLAIANAGEIDILWNICRSRAIKDVTRWISIPRVFERHRPSMRDAVLEIANCYCGPTLESRNLSAQRAGTPRHPFPKSLVEAGSVVVSSELIDLLAKDGEQCTDEDATALLRALVLFEWSKGIGFNDIRRRFQSFVRSAEDAPKDKGRTRISLHYADVEQLSEQVAGVLRGVAEVAVADDGIDFGPLVRRLASQVESGLPVWLIPAKRLRFDWLHRETLSFLWEEGVSDDALLSLFERDEFRSNPGIPNSELDQAAREIALRVHERRVSRVDISKSWANKLIPNGEGDTFGDLASELESCDDSASFAATLNGLARDLGLSVDSRTCKPGDADVNLMESTVWSDGNDSITVLIPRSILTVEMVNSVSRNKSIVVLWSDIPDTAAASLARPSHASFVTPEHLLTAIARAVDDIGDDFEGADAVEILSGLRGGGVDPEAWYVADRPLGGAPPFKGELPGLDAT